MTAAPARQRAEKHGRRAETVAALLLRLKGYSILATRHRTPLGEIDLVARRGGMLIFVEVKARRTPEAALEAVTFSARRRIVHAAGLFLSRHPALADCAVRYDIIAIAGWRVHHLADAWREGE